MSKKLLKNREKIANIIRRMKPNWHVVHGAHGVPFIQIGNDNDEYMMMWDGGKDFQVLSILSNIGEARWCLQRVEHVDYIPHERINVMAERVAVQIVNFVEKYESDPDHD